MTPLPIDSFLPAIVAAARAARRLVLVAPPGAGKTTRVPPALLAAGLLSADHPNLVMLQPRRVAARAAAQRIAEENGWELGREVGYHVRFDKRVGPATRLRVLTEGILTRQLVDDPFLEGTGAVLLDEFHERSLHTDVAVALLREIRQTVRDDLILVVMSATLEAEPVARFLGDPGKPCPIVRAEGPAYPVEIAYDSGPVPASPRDVPDRAASAVARVLAGDWSGATPDPGAGAAAGQPPPPPDPGDVLVFLPGAEEIRRTLHQLAPLAGRDDLLLLPLHGSLPAEEQALALRPARRRKVICASNIAETSLTIDGVRTVIDAGLARVASYDPQRGLDRLELKRISKASAAQRAGRAGRTAPGRCLRLWPLREDRFLDDFELPEVRRVDLCGTVLALHAWGRPDPRRFGWYEAPPEETLAAAERLLRMLGALDGEPGGRITPLGRRMLGLPAHPRVARLLMAAAEAGATGAGAALAALLSEKDIAAPAFEGRHEIGRSKVQGASDLLIRLDLLGQAERANFAPHLRDRGIDPAAARQAARTRDELLRVAGRLAPAAALHGGATHGGKAGGRGAEPSPAEESTLLRLALWAYPDRVCRRRGSDPDAAVMVGGSGVRLARESVVCRAEFFVALDARRDERSPSREALVRVAGAIEADWLEEMFPHEIRREKGETYDAERERVVGRSAAYYRDLLLREDVHAAVDPRRAGEVLAGALRPRAAEFFAADEAAVNVLRRTALLRRAVPEHPWPAFDADELAELLASACAGKRSAEEVRRASLAPLLLSRLAYPLDRLLDQHAPEAIQVPTGNRIRVQYAGEGPPVLTVRLQELFGWTDTPRVAAGRVPVLLHLLGPNYRPVQITDDLRSFWTTTYFQVRKDLRTRYPKHSWPEDPLTAKPEAKGRPRA